MCIPVSKESNLGQCIKSSNEVSEVRVKSEKRGQNKSRTVVRAR